MIGPTVQLSDPSSAGRVRPPSWRLDLLITCLGLLGLVLVLLFYDRAFPSAALDLQLSRAEIAQRAEAYLASQGYQLEGYEFALSFEEARLPSFYLQQTLGIQEANRLIRAEGLPIWTWYARWFRPLQQEEFSVSLNPDGQVVAFSHSLPEEAPGASLTQDQARALAATYLVQDRGWSLEDWEPVSASTQDQPGGRVDHYFEWKRRAFAVGDGDLRLSLSVQGDRADGYSLRLRVPEAFERHFSEQSNLAGFFNNLSLGIGLVGFGLAALLSYLVATWRGNLRWYAGLPAAVAVAVVSLLAGLNTLPLRKAWYDTTQDYTLFWLQEVIFLAYGAAFIAAAVLILWAGGGRLAKVAWPRQDKILPRGDGRWEILARSSWRGVMLGGLMGAYVVVFYLVATQLFGSWTPLDVPYTDLYATPLPFLGPLQSGLLPAIAEELTFRLVGVSLLLWLTRRRWLALLVPGALWAFAHLSYVRDPFYLRGIELLIAAVFLEGLFFLRFDLTTTIVAHFAYNAGLGALPLLRSGEPYFAISGLIVLAFMLAPVVPGMAIAVRRRLRGEKKAVAPIQIRQGASADREKLAALPIQGPDWATLLDGSRAAAVCLQAGDDLAGVAAGRVSDAGIGQVLAVYVAPRWRRRYWGSALMDKLGAELRAQGAQSMHAEVEAGDRVALAFWASQGWRPAVKVFAHSLVPPQPLGWRDTIKRWTKPER